RVQDLVGHKIVLYAWTESGVSRVAVVDVEGQLDPAFEAELLQLKAPRPIQYAPKQRYGSLWASTDVLSPSGIVHFGGKAANYGMLRRYVPTNCPPAIAFSFDLWDDFLDQALPGGTTLRAEIAAQLAPFTNYPPDIAALKSSLAAIRSLFTTTAAFSPAQEQQITNALLSFFDPSRKIRFRSSTNVEDSEQFTGAGLYDSYSGCLLDDLDGDIAGPCRCDPAEAAERGVFRALRKVYAGFYNDDAFLERLAHRVNEREVGMAVLVHHSFPDEEELANGVATPRFRFAFGPTHASGDLVTQLGAVSVTNPDGNSIPEIVFADDLFGKVAFTLKQQSSLVPLGGKVMNWPADYEALVRLVNAVAAGFHQYYPAKSNLSLAFEYKKDVNLGVALKQVREVPQPTTGGSTSQVYLLDAPVTFSVAQKEGSDVFASHRLKSLWNLHTANISLVASNLARGIYTEGTCEYVDQGAVQRLLGPLDSWPGAWHSPAGTVNGWTTGSGSGRRDWRLQTSITTNLPAPRPPFLTQADFPKSLGVTYAQPVPILRGGAPYTTTNEAVALEVCPVITAADLPEERIFTNGSITIQTRFYLGAPPRDAIIIWTAPLLRFVETRITGLTTEPIVLTGYYSQTYHPFHHNFGEECIFEPWLEPGLSPAILTELDAANIQWIYVWSDYNRTIFWVLGRDGLLRRL
ncbi:MAG TPA: PEP/pyruvate-binding domain-containing protein, partial [Verrucomicrobiae bacterium]